MWVNALPKRFLRLSLVVSLPILALAFFLLPAQIARAGGEVTDCSDDTDLHAQLSGGGLVTFNCGSAPVTINLTTTDLPGSHINITQTTTISGGGLITLQGNGAARILSVNGTSLTLEGLTIAGGRAPLSPNDEGGAIYIIGDGVVNITDSTLFDNEARFGGAVYVVNSALTVTNGSLHDNQADFGGAIYVEDTAPADPASPATATILNSAIISNTAIDGDGGGIRIWNATLTLANSTLSNNRAVEITGGTGGNGGAIGVGGTEARDFSRISITNTTIYSNAADNNGGGVHIYRRTGSGLVKNSIVANNTANAEANCSAINLASDGNNLASDDTCDFNASGDLTNTDPLLGPLADNGGNTLTHAPLPGSPVINAADNNACAAPPVSNLDQRGVSRPQGLTCDMGAVEATANLSLTKSSTSEGGDPVQPSERITYTIVVTNSGSLTATNGLISDSTPANTTFVPGSISLTPPGAGTTGTAPPVLASDLTIAPNQPISVAFAVAVDLPLPNGTLITNTASLTSAETPSPVSDTVTDTVTSAPSLAILKSSEDANGGELIPGETLTYTIVVSNSGTANATGAVISDAVPANTTFVPGSISLTPPGAGTPGTAPPVLASDLTVTTSQPVTVAFAVAVDLPLPNGTVITNTASLTSTETPSPVSDTVTDTVTSAPSLAVLKSSEDANGGELIPGETLTYTIVVSNSGTANATGAVLFDAVPANTTFVPGSISLTPPGAGTPGAVPPVLASDLAIDVGEVVTAAFAVTVDLPLPNGTVIANTASLTSTETPSPVSDTVTDTVTSATSLAILKSSQDANGDALNPGDTIDYTIVISNSGTASATGAVLSDPLPANTTFVPGSISLTPPGAGTPGTAPPTLASDLTVTPSQPVTVAFAVVVNIPLPDGTVIANTASFTSTEAPSPISDSVTDTVISTPSLAIRKRAQDANGGALNPGDTITYTIVVNNSGTEVATGAVISDTLPANTTFLPGSLSLTPPDAGTPETGPPTLVSYLTIAPGQPVAVTFAVMLDRPLDDGTIIANTASVTSTQVTAPVTDSIISIVSTNGAINVVKDGPLMASVDETVVYTFTVTNVGDTLLENVQVVDDYAGPANYVSGDDDDDLRLGLTETWVYTASYTVQPGDPDPLINTVDVTATDALNTLATDSDQHTTNLGPPIRLPIISKDYTGP